MPETLPETSMPETLPTLVIADRRHLLDAQVHEAVSARLASPPSQLNRFPAPAALWPLPVVGFALSMRLVMRLARSSVLLAYPLSPASTCSCSCPFRDPRLVLSTVFTLQRSAFVFRFHSPASEHSLRPRATSCIQVNYCRISSSACSFFNQFVFYTFIYWLIQ